jgi:hypothetical protein
VSLKQHSKARQAFEQGLALAPGDKSFIAQLDKLRNAPSEYSTTPIAGASASSSVSSGNVKPIRSPSGSASAPTNTSSTAATSTTKDDDSRYDGESTKFRGYKKTADGRVTTFFHNELDEQTKALIGDIAPKKIDPAVAAPVEGSGGIEGEYF